MFASVLFDSTITSSKMPRLHSRSPKLIEIMPKRRRYSSLGYVRFTLMPDRPRADLARCNGTIMSRARDSHASRRPGHLRPPLLCVVGIHDVRTPSLKV